MRRVLVPAFAVLVLAACSDAVDDPDTPGRDGQTRAELADAARRVNAAVFTRPPAREAEERGVESGVPLAPGQTPPPDVAAPPIAPQPSDPVVTRAQVLLDRAGFSPGVIDGRYGENVRQAVAAYERAKGLTVDGELDAAVFAALTAADPAPAMTAYVITAEDVAGPFVGSVPQDLETLATLPRVGYADAREALAERFHMDPDLLSELNPGVDFARAETTITVTDPGRSGGFTAARIEVDKAERAVRAFDAEGRLLAFYPASIGSESRPAPDGTVTVEAVAPDAAYYYDPARLTWGTAQTRLKIAPGPNNPVGGIWIDLSAEGYGIHGTPEPEKVGKTFSHGCVRLTNWDARELSRAVKAGVPVVFLGARTETGRGAP